MAEVKIPPHSQEAERSILGSILIDKDGIITVAEFLRPEHFYHEAHRIIFDACLTLFEERKPIDVITLAEKLKKKKDLAKIGGRAYLADLTEGVPTAANIESYGKIVKDDYIKRELINAATGIAQRSFDESSEAGQALDMAEQAVFSLSQRHMRQAFVSVKETLADSFDRLDELYKKAGGLRGLPSGFKDLDDALAGFQPSNLIILASRPGMGKTALVLNIAQHIAVEQKIPLGFFSLEMSKEELVDRMLVAQADIDAWRLKTGRLEEDDFTKLSEAMGILAESPLYVDDTPALSILEMRTKARRLMVEHKAQFFIVDYLQLARSRQLENRVQEVSEISQGLKNLARELKVPILACSQLSRAVEQRGKKRPQLADLRECLVGETLVMDAKTGNRLTLKQLYNSQQEISLLAMDSKGKLESIQAEKVTCSGKKKVFKLVTQSGREIIASANHPFFTPEGWRILENLKEGELIAIPRHLPVEVNSGLNLSRAKFLGYLVSDGSYKKYRTCGFTNNDPQVASEAIKITRREFDIQCHIDDHHRSWNIDFVKTFKNGYGKPGGNRLINWLKEMGIYGQGAKKKRVPEIVFQSSNKTVAQFLKGLFTGDGTIVHRKSGRWEIKYAAKNKELIFDVLHLLLRLGITASVRKGRKREFEIYYLEISGRDGILTFLEKIGFVGRKQRKANLCRKELLRRGNNPRKNLYPLGLADQVAQIAKENGYSWKKLGYRCQGKRISRSWLAKMANTLENQELMQMAESDLDWEKVKDIGFKGKALTYDICVPGHHNFVANDILVHNSGAIEQDADVVMFLWRPDEEVLENIMLNIAKHRNGPLREIPLFWKGERIRFYGVEKKREKE